MWLVTSVVDKPFSFLCFTPCWVCMWVGGCWISCMLDIPWSLLFHLAIELVSQRKGKNGILELNSDVNLTFTHWTYVFVCVSVWIEWFPGNRSCGWFQWSLRMGKWWCWSLGFPSEHYVFLVIVSRASVVQFILLLYFCTIVAAKWLFHVCFSKYFVIYIF